MLIGCVKPCLSYVGDSICHKEYQLVVGTKNNTTISGIMIMECDPRSSNINGTIINEFGIKVFDFSISQNKMRLINIFAPIDKWYIRKVLRKDLNFIVKRLINKNISETGKKPRMNVNMRNDTIVFENRRYNIKYSLVQLK